MNTPTHLSLAELEVGLEEIRKAPREVGVVKLIVRRPIVNEREVLDSVQLNLREGVPGDHWSERVDPHALDDDQDRDTQLTIMNFRAVALIAPDAARRPLAGDQLYVDFDLSVEQLPAGTQLAIGEAVVEVSSQPHNGCRKFAARFGADAVKFVNSPEGKRLRLRGLNAKVVRAGTVRVGDAVRKAAER